MPGNPVGLNGNLRATHHPSVSSGHAGHSDATAAAIRGAARAFDGHISKKADHPSANLNGALAAATIAGTRARKPNPSSTVLQTPLSTPGRHRGDSIHDTDRLSVRDRITGLESRLEPQSTGSSIDVGRSPSRSPSQIAAQLAAGKVATRGTRKTWDDTDATDRSRSSSVAQSDVEFDMSKSAARTSAAASARSSINTTKPTRPLLPGRTSTSKTLSLGEIPQLDATKNLPYQGSTLDKPLFRIDKSTVHTPVAPRLHAAAPLRSDDRQEEISHRDDSRPKLIQPKKSSASLTPSRTNSYIPLSENGTSKSISPSRKIHGVDQPPPQHDVHVTVPPPLKDQLTGMTESSLADAIVASSLASSRAPSPSKAPPAPIPRRSKSRSFLFSRSPEHEKTPPSASPVRGMRQTMRGQPKSDNEDESHGPAHKRSRRLLVKKHPNKHHEGDRKRWRDQVTERERKRYEGLWAANKGLHISRAPLAYDFEDNPVSRIKRREDDKDMIINLVVRDIWSRSKLPFSVLEEVWDLVDLRRTDRLSREEFVVGMWLIDQALKGRKLPAAVSSSVWTSVKQLSGIKIHRHR